MKRRFTLLEILVVLAIMALVMGTVMPRVMRIPKRVQIEGARTDILGALRDCSVRAVASGMTVRAKLDAAGNTFQVSSVAPAKDVLSESKLAESASDEAQPGAALVLPTRTSYKLAKEISWELDEWRAGSGSDAVPEYSFFPDGEATGPELVFSVAKRRFALRVDRLTGRADITPVE